MENIKEKQNNLKVVKKKMSLNKKLLLFGILPLSIMLVSALTYYALFSVSFTVSSAISVTGDLQQELSPTYSGETIYGEPITITNNAPSSREISLSDNSKEDIEVSYISDLALTHKDLNDWTAYGEPVTIKYVVVGGSFEVIGVPEGYVAVYYPNKNTYDYYDGVVVLEEDVTILPESYDLNGGEQSDYCTNEYNSLAVQCVGAKLWLVPTDAVTDNVINWGRANEFYFETSLIQYSPNGNLVLSSGSSLTLTPVYEIDNYAEGEYTITTTIA